MHIIKCALKVHEFLNLCMLISTFLAEVENELFGQSVMCYAQFYIQYKAVRSRELKPL